MLAIANIIILLVLYVGKSCLKKNVQAYLKRIEGSVPNHCNKASITIKRLIIFLLVETLAFNV